MDLRTHLGVIWRWRVFFAVGIALALLLTFFSYYKVSLADGLTHRQGVTWQSSEMLQLTQPGCEYCRAVPGATTDLAWLTTLTTVYAQIANGDALRSRVFRGQQTDANYFAAPVQDPVTPSQSQFLTFTGTGDVPGRGREHRSASDVDIPELSRRTVAGRQGFPRRPRRAEGRDEGEAWQCQRHQGQEEDDSDHRVSLCPGDDVRRDLRAGEPVPAGAHRRSAG